MNVAANVDSDVSDGPKTWVRLTVEACERFGACELYPVGGSPIFCGPIGAQCNGNFGKCLDIPDRWCVNGT
jgi:hypothetical protein